MRTIQQQTFGLWELAVLALLREAAMHPYQMQKLLHERHKDELLALKRGSLYHAIDRLERAALISSVRTDRQGKRPERTTYRITPSGKKELLRWLHQMIGVPLPEPSDFMAALSFLPFLTVNDAADKLEARIGLLETQIAELTERLESASAWLARIHLVELEYLVTMRKAEATWVRSLLTDLRSRTLEWDLPAILKEAQVVKMRAEAAATAPVKRKKKVTP